MAKIELNIVALGDFSAVNAQIKALQLQVDALNKGVAGVGLGPALTKDLAAAQAAFKSTMLSTGQFTAQTVKMASETEKFGQALVAGKLKLSDYFNIITGKAGQATASMNALAESQIRLQNSIVVKNKQGFLDVYTPTAFNSVAQAEELVAMKSALMQKAINGGSTALINFGKNTQWAGRQLTVGLTMPMVMFGAAAVKSFQATNVELTRLQRLYGEGLTPPSQAQLNAISSQVLTLGKQIAQTMGIAQTETVKTAANFAAMGKQGQDLLNIVTQTERLSKLGGVDSQQATNAIVALQNVYKVSTNQLADAVNFLSDVQKQTTMSLSDMTDAIPKVGPIMQQLGGTYKDTAVMLLAMREAGIPAAQSANALKSAMASIIAPTSAATKEFASFGINLNAIKDAGGPVQMIQQLQEGLSKLTPLVREQLIEKLFGKFQFARVSALIENFGKAGSQTINALKVAGATSTELANLANQEMKQATSSVSAKWTRALEGFKATLYPIGQKFVEMGSIILNVANKIGNAFSKLPSPLKGFFGFIVMGAAIAGPLIMLTGLLSNFAGYLLKGVGLVHKLATGGMTLKELLTPEIIASQKAAELFSNQIANDVNAVDLFQQAVERLTASLAGMSGAMVTGTGDVATKVAATTALANKNPNYAMYGAMTAQEYGFLARQGTLGVTGQYKAGKNANPAFQKLDANTTVYSKPTTGVFAKPVLGASNTALANGGVESQAYLNAMTEVTGETKDFAKKYKTSTSLFLDALTQQTITLQDGTKKAVLTDDQAYALKEELNMAFEKEILSLGVVNDMNNPLAAVEKDVMIKLEKMAAEIGLSEEELHALTMQMRMGMSNVFEDVNRGGGGHVWLGGEGTGLERFKIELTGIEKENIQFWHSFNEEAKAAWEKVLVDMRGAGTQIVEYQSALGEAAATAFTESEIAMLRKLNPQLLQQSVILEEEVSKAREEMAAASGALVAEMFSKSEIAMLEQVYPDILSATVLNEQEIANAKLAIQEATLAKETVIAEEEAKVRSKAGMGAAMGIGMGGTMLGMSMSSSKNSTINTLGTGVTAGANAAMMASFMPGATAALGGLMGAETAFPPLLAITAAVAGVAIGIKALVKHMDDIKAHNAAVAASFQPASSAISTYGGTMITATQAVYNFNSANKETGAVLSKTAQDVAGIAKLSASDPLKQVGDLLKGGTNAQDVIGTVERFAAAQVANGMDPKGVSQMVTDLLTYAGKTQYLNAALKEVSTSTDNMVNATTTWLNKLKNTGDAAVITATSYSDMSNSQKAYAQALLSTTNIISAQNTPIQTVIDKLKAMGIAGDNSVGGINALALALENAGQKAAGLQMSALAAMGATNQAFAASVLMLNQEENTNLVVPGNASKTESNVANALKKKVVQDNANALIDANKKVADDQAQIDKITKAAQAANSTAATQTKAQKDAVAALGAEEAKNYFGAKSQVKALDAQLTVQKQITSELQAQQQYQLSQAQIDSQIRTAVASGDFMQATLLRQQKAADTSKYNGDTKNQQMQDQIDNLNAQIAIDEEKIAAKQTANANISSATASAQAQLAIDKSLQATAKLNTSLSTELPTINALLNASGLPNWQAIIKNGSLQVYMTGAKDGLFSGTADKPIQLPGGSGFTKSAQGSGYVPDLSKFGKGASAGNDLSQVLTWLSLVLGSDTKPTSSNSVDQFVKKYAAANNVQSGKYFSIPQNGKIYEFLMKKDGNITEIGVGSQGQVYDPVKKAFVTTKPVTTKATGGHITGPGTGTSDSIPAYLSNGEYVVKADSVAHYGKSFFDSVNAKKFAKGGMPNVLKFTEASRELGLATGGYISSGKVQHFKSGGIFGAVEGLWHFLNSGPKNLVINGKTVQPMGAMDAPISPSDIGEFYNALGFITKLGKRSAEDIVSLIKTGRFTDKQIGSGLLRRYAEGTRADNAELLKVPDYWKYVNTLREKTTGEMWRGIGVGKPYYGTPESLKNGLPSWLNSSIAEIKKIHSTPTMSLVEKRRASGGLLDALLGKEFIMGPRSWTTEKDIARTFAKSATLGNGRAATPNGLKEFLLKTHLQNTNALNVSKLFPDLTYSGGQAMNEAESVFGGKFKIDRAGIDGLILKQVFGKANGGMVKLPSFDVGTNFVPQDMIAQIHKGEAIIPASQNNGTMGSIYNITVNAGSSASADDIAKAVMDTIKRNNGMTSTNRRVSV